MGAAIAQAFALVFSNALRLYLVWHFVRIQPYDRYYARPDPHGDRRRGDARRARRPGRSPLGHRLAGHRAIGGAAYYAAFLFFGLTPEEKQGIMAMLGRATGRAKSPVA